MLNKFKNFMKKYGFIVAIILFAIIKQLMVSNVPITPYPNQLADDDMMVEMAKNIREGNWLGEYNSNVLVKGPVFPLFLAITNFLGLSYTGTVTFIYTLACIYFIYCIKELFKSKKSLIAIYIVLLFNPVSYAWWTFQRVYRNGITLSQVLFIIGSLFAMYQRKNNKATKMLSFAIIGGISIASLWLNREDGIWILPFIAVVTIIILVNIIKNFLKNKNKKILISKLLVAILPIIILVMSTNLIRLINYNVYGVYEYNEINDGYFGKVIKTIYSVKNDENIKFVTATRKKINMLYEYSPTLKSIKKELEKSMDEWDFADRTPGDKQVEDGWFWWSLKGAAEVAGKHKDAKTANEFYKNIYDEINSAIKAGKIDTQFTMPSNLMSPWKNEYFLELAKHMAGMAYYVASFGDVTTVNVAGDVPNNEKGIRKFEALTNDLAVSNQMKTSVENPTKYTKTYVDRVNFIGGIYKNTGLIFTVIGIIIYLIMTVKLIIAKFKNGNIDLWLLLTGIGGSLIVLIAGVAYNHVTSCFSRYYMYLSGAYPLIIAFNMMSITSFIEQLGGKNAKSKNSIK